MEIVQLWGLQDVYDYIYKNILDPVWEFVSSCISTGFTYLANGISIALNAVLNSLFGEIISIFLDWFYAKWFALQSAILLLLDCIEDCFNIVSGLSPVYLRAGGGTRAVTGRGVPILLAVFQQKAVQNAIIVMIIVGFWLCFAMAILATAKTILELGGEQSKPVTHVLKMTAKSLLYLVLAPFTAVALILLSQAILTTIDKGLTEGEGKTSIARIIFCISSLDAIDTSITSDGAEYNVSYADGPSKASLTDKYRAKFYYEDDHFLIPNFVNPIVARLTFTFWGFDYFISLGCGIFFTVIMCMVLAVFIGRIFDVVVLLIIEPFFVAMMPFDDGEYYKKWFELFLGKLFQGFGSVVGMRVYLMILEQLFAGNISFSNSNSIGARLQDYLIMLLFAMGGGVAVQHVGPLITGILSQGAASGEQAYAAAGGAVGKYIANKEMGFVKKAATSTAKKIGGGIGMGLMEIAKFQGRRGGAGGAGGMGGPGGIGGAAGAAGGAGGALGALGQFVGMRPQGGSGGKPGTMGAIGGGGAVSSMQQSLSSVKTSVMAAGLINNNPKGTGADKGGKKDEKAPNAGKDNKGVQMSEMLQGVGNKKGSEGDQGSFRGGNQSKGSNAGGGKPGGESPSKGNSGGKGSSGSVNKSSGAGKADQGSSNSDGQKTMQDIVSGNQDNDPLNTAFIDDGNDDGGRFDSGSVNQGSSGSVNQGSGGSANRSSGGSVNRSSSGSANLGNGSVNQGSSGLGSSIGSSGGGSQSTMQDLVGNTGDNSLGSGQATMQDIVSGNQDNDPLNTAFIDDGNDSGGSFDSGSLGGGSLGGGSLGGGSLGGGSLGGGSLGGGSLAGGSLGGGSLGGGSLGGGSLGGGSLGGGSLGGGSLGGGSLGGGSQSTMQDLVGNTGDSSLGGGTVTMQDIVSGSQNNDALNTAFIDDGNDYGGSFDSGSQSSGQMTMQDIIDGGDDPLNSGFINYDNDDDDGAF